MRGGLRASLLQMPGALRPGLRKGRREPAGAPGPAKILFCFPPPRGFVGQGNRDLGKKAEAAQGPDLCPAGAVRRGGRGPRDFVRAQYSPASRDQRQTGPGSKS
jgi:hypothetical protein